MSEVVIANLTTQRVTWYDVGLYHFGSIRWLAEHGAVPGLALINSKFGFTSSWFALAAPFNPEIFGSRVSAVTKAHGIDQSRFFLPPELPSENVVTERINDIEYVFPQKTDKCWAAKLPCAPEPITQNIKLRNPARGIEAGFIQVK